MIKQMLNKLSWKSMLILAGSLLFVIVLVTMIFRNHSQDKAGISKEQKELAGQRIEVIKDDTDGDTTIVMENEPTDVPKTESRDEISRAIFVEPINDPPTADEPKKGGQNADLTIGTQMEEAPVTDKVNVKDYCDTELDLDVTEYSNEKSEEKKNQIDVDVTDCPELGSNPTVMDVTFTPVENSDKAQD